MNRPPRQATAAPRRSALILGLAVACAGMVLGIAYTLTAPRILDSRDALLRREVLTLLPPAGQYDNDPVRDSIPLDVTPGDAGSARPTQLYRARLGGQVAGAVLALSTDRGYAGDITLLLGVDAAGVLQGVRVVSHRETPGLGDAIDTHRSDWIRQFDGIAVTGMQQRDWRLAREGGRIDGLTGASVTSRAVIDAVRDALAWYQPRRDALFAGPAGTVPEASSP